MSLHRIEKLFKYFKEGIVIAANCVVLGIIAYFLVLGIMLLLKKRTREDIKAKSVGRFALEMVFSICICTILKITGIISNNITFSFSPGNLLGFFEIPFVGAATKMVMLNFLLFVPYGFLFFFVFKKPKMTWWKALIVGFLTSFCIELIQAFIGRLTEIDDLIINSAGFLSGYLLARSAYMFFGEKKRLKGLICMILVIAVSAGLLIFLYMFSKGKLL